MVIFKTKAELSPLFIDMISITLKLQPHEQQSALVAMKAMIENGYAKPCHKGGRYWQSIYLGTGHSSENLFLVQAQPKQPQIAFLRVEFNPAKCPPAEVRIELDKIIPSGGYSRLFKEGTCTRADVTVDVRFAAIEKLLVWIPGLRVNRAYSSGSRAESLVYGSVSSDRIVRVYDKVRQLKKANSKTPYKADVPDHAVTRLEVQLRHRFLAKDLAELKNPFDKIIISNPSKSVFNDQLGRMFLLVCEAYGAQRALAALDNDKAAYVEKLKTAGVAWWHPTKLWTQWGAVVDSLINPVQWDSNLPPTYPKPPAKVGIAGNIVQLTATS